MIFSAADTQAAENGPAVSGRVAPLYLKAFEILSRQIMRGDLAAGSRIQETQIANRFGISRAPARQALALLEERGLVTKRESRGYEVCGQSGRTPAKPDETMLAEKQIQLSARSSWERIYQEVQGEIVARIAFGSWRIKEVELARYHKVSRTVARDVLGRLQQRGVVQKDERSRWYAPALTPDHVAELYELRWVLEPLALKKAADLIPAADILEARENLADAINSPQPPDGTILDQLEEDLHVKLLGHCPNKALIQTITMHQSLLVAHNFLYRFTPRLFATEPFLPEHQTILECLARREFDAAAAALEHHLRVSLDRAISRVADVTARFQPNALPYLELRLD
ncbi:GntR family transcriptional regulator [Nitratireductor basaltis]|uniref:Transcriptional regulator, GntR family n=1 Tax=Nitratireductor basaltis TaxID=472175 RepID=A0A084U8T9_9HYPH|nr:GntR family transcriptional regulator [Nitratireductor basaltis]KFB09375.1 Transcriptional regulator, GntR family [Nitratireductor basaltis]